MYLKTITGKTPIDLETKVNQWMKDNHSVFQQEPPFIKYITALVSKDGYREYTAFIILSQLDE